MKKKHNQYRISRISFPTKTNSKPKHRTRRKTRKPNALIRKVEPNKQIIDVYINEIRYYSKQNGAGMPHIVFQRETKAAIVFQQPRVEIFSPKIELMPNKQAADFRPGSFAR